MGNVIYLDKILKPVVCVVPDHDDDIIDGECRSVFGWAHFSYREGILKSGEFYVDVPHSKEEDYYRVIRNNLKQVVHKWQYPSKPVIHYPFVQTYNARNPADVTDKAGLMALKAFAREHDYRLKCSRFNIVQQTVFGREQEILKIIDLLRDLGMDISYDEQTRAKAISFAYYEHFWKWQKDHEQRNSDKT